MPRQKTIRYIRSKQSISDWFAQLISRRETLWFFILKDLKVQYQNPVFGFIWSIVQPAIYFGIILALMHFSGRNSSTDVIPFSMFLICGLAVWNLTTNSILGSVNSIQSNAGIISKSYFPRFYIILAPVLKQLLDFSILSVLVLGLSIYENQPPTLAFLPLLFVSVFIGLTTILGWASIAASLIVWNRHVRHIIPVFLYALMFVLPVFYSTQSIDNEIVSTLYALSPIAGAMDCFRAGFSGKTPELQLITGWIFQSVIWLTVGVFVFQRTEKTLADSI